MASDCKSPRKKKGKGGKERKWENKTSRKAGRKAKRQVDRQKDWQTGMKRSRKKEFCRTFIFVGLKIGCRPPSRFSSQTPLTQFDGIQLWTSKLAIYLSRSFERG